jgi:hypothetical protein
MLGRVQDRDGVDDDVTETMCPCLARCPGCGNEIRMRLLTWEGFWGLRVVPHGQRVTPSTTMPCPGANVTLRKGKIR